MRYCMSQISGEKSVGFIDRVMTPYLLSLVLISLGSLAPAQSTRAAELGTFFGINHFIGTDTRVGTYQDFNIPPTDTPMWIDLTVKGADGGNAETTGPFTTNCFQGGGKGAEVSARLLTGVEAGRLSPGGKLRFIIGGHGQDGRIKRSAFGNNIVPSGGGGGTAVLYQESPSSNWVPLIVAGGGGGAYQGLAFYVCVNNNSGSPGNTVITGANAGCGTGGGGQNGTAGGCNGNAGNGYDDPFVPSGAGAGAYTRPFDSVHAAQKGHPTGGSGGNRNRNGGFGYGGGGGGKTGGGGGGGYSGGGLSTDFHGGGGGGSYVNPTFSDPANATAVVSTSATRNGWISYAWGTRPSNANNFCVNATPMSDGKIVSSTAFSGLDGSPWICDEICWHDAWFSYSNPNDYDLVVTADTCQLETVFQTVLEVLDTCGGNILTCGTPRTCIAPGGTLFQHRAKVTWTVPAGATHYIRLSGAGGTDGAYGMDVSSVAVAPVNNSYAGAIALTPEASYDGRTIGASLAAPTTCSGTIDSPSVWYSYTNSSQTPEWVTVDSCDPATNFPCAITTFDASGATELACSSQACGNGAYVNWLVPAGATHRICVSGIDGAEGRFRLSVNAQADSDGDTVPDIDDFCPGQDDLIDCDLNGVPDACDSGFLARYNRFDVDIIDDYRLNGTASFDRESIRLTEALPNQLGTVVFSPVTTASIDRFHVEFDFKIGGGGGADGMAFVLFNADLFGDDIGFGEFGNGQPFVVSFNTYAFAPGRGNNVTLISNNVTLADVLLAAPLNDEQWQHASITFDGSAATVRITDGSGQTTTPIDAVAVPGFNPIHARYAFGARTGGVTDEHRVDNVYFQTLDQTSDCDANGVPDACEGGDGDSDADGVNDVCDICADTVSGTTVNSLGCDITGDECALANVIDAGVLFSSTLLDNTGAIDDDDCGSGNQIAEWFAFTPGASGAATFTTCNPGTEFDSILSVFDGCPSDGGAQLACNDDTPGAPSDCNLSGQNRKSTVTLPVSAGTTYYIRVSVFGDDFSAYGGFGMGFELSIDVCVAGDVDNDGQVTMADLPTFVDSVMAQNLVDPADVCRADVNGDGQLDGLDLQGFVNVLAP